MIEFFEKTYLTENLQILLNWASQRSEPFTRKEFEDGCGLYLKSAKEIIGAALRAGIITAIGKEHDPKRAYQYVGLETLIPTL